MTWRIHHKAETESTNLDARAGEVGDVYTADFQTAGRGRLDHRWESSAGSNLLMSVVLGVGDAADDKIAVLPLVIGMAVAKALSTFCKGLSPQIKWPNDVMVEGRKIVGILCERNGDKVIAGIGVNVGTVPDKFVKSGNSLTNVANTKIEIADVRDAILTQLDVECELWCRSGFSAIYRDLEKYDCLKDRYVEVMQTDADAEPVRGICGGIRDDGALMVGKQAIYAGEAHVRSFACD